VEELCSDQSLPHTQQNSFRHTQQVMWLQPPRFSMGARQRVQARVCSFIQPSLPFSASAATSATTLRHADTWEHNSRPSSATSSAGYVSKQAMWRDEACVNVYIRKLLCSLPMPYDVERVQNLVLMLWLPSTVYPVAWIFAHDIRVATRQWSSLAIRIWSANDPDSKQHSHFVYKFLS
jgi:hypothetical protein